MLGGLCALSTRVLLLENTIISYFCRKTFLSHSQWAVCGWRQSHCRTCCVGLHILCHFSQEVSRKKRRHLRSGFTSRLVLSQLNFTARLWLQADEPLRMPTSPTGHVVLRLIVPFKKCVYFPRTTAINITRNHCQYSTLLRQWMFRGINMNIHIRINNYINIHICICIYIYCENVWVLYENMYPFIVGFISVSWTGSMCTNWGKRSSARTRAYLMFSWV